jgi:hypothetical protein
LGASSAALIFNSLVVSPGGTSVCANCFVCPFKSASKREVGRKREGGRERGWEGGRERVLREDR